MSKKLLVLSGVSGVGKSTAIKRLLDEHDFHFSVSTTSRCMREGETCGYDYHFVEREDFVTMIDNGDFVEHMDFAGNLYGTTFDAIDNSKYDRLILDVEYSGYKALKDKYGDRVVGCFLHHEDKEELKKRLLNRSGLNEINDEIATRLDKMDQLIALRNEYDHVIDVTTQSVESVVAEILKVMK